MQVPKVNFQRGGTFRVVLSYGSLYIPAKGSVTREERWKTFLIRVDRAARIRLPRRGGLGGEEGREEGVREKRTEGASRSSGKGKVRRCAPHVTPF